MRATSKYMHIERESQLHSSLFCAPKMRSTLIHMCASWNLRQGGFEAVSLINVVVLYWLCIIHIHLFSVVVWHGTLLIYSFLFAAYSTRDRTSAWRGPGKCTSCITIYDGACGKLQNERFVRLSDNARDMLLICHGIMLGHSIHASRSTRCRT